MQCPPWTQQQCVYLYVYYIITAAFLLSSNGIFAKTLRYGICQVKVKSLNANSYSIVYNLIRLTVTDMNIAYAAPDDDPHGGGGFD